MTDNNKTIEFKGKLISISEARKIVENNIARLKEIELEKKKERSLVDRILEHKNSEPSKSEVKKMQRSIEKSEREGEIRKALLNKHERNKPRPRRLIEQIKRNQKDHNN